MSFDLNAWYTIQNYGNDFFLGCASVGNCVTATEGLTNPELFQIATANDNQSYYIRPKALNNDTNGNAYCVNINTGQPAVTTCSNVSAIWGIGDWHGNNSGDGVYFYAIPSGDSQRMYLSNNQTYSLMNYAGLSESQQLLMQWGVSSRSVINDQSYSTVPAAITGGAILTTTTSTANSTTTVSATSSSESSISSTTSSNTAGSTSSSESSSESLRSSSVAAASPSTVTTIVTPTVTASGPANTGTTRASTPSSAMSTAISGAHGLNTGTICSLALMLALPQILMLSL